MQKLVWQNANGDSIDLTSGNYGITQWEGFSNASLNIQSQQVPFQDGAVFLDALLNQRELSVTLKMQDNGNLEERYRMRRELIHILNPKLGEGYLIYTNDFISKRIKCVAQVPLFETHNSDTRGTPKASLAWTACEPYWEDLEETEIVIQSDSNVEIINNGEVPIATKVEIKNVDSTIIMNNFTTGEVIETTQSKKGDIDIDTNFGKKEIILKESKYNFLYGGVINGCCIYQDGLILCGSNISKLNYVDNKTSLIETNQPTQIFVDITYSSSLKLFVAITEEKIYTSTNLTEWQERYTYTGPYRLYIVSWEDSVFKVKTNVGIDAFLKSTDGINWVAESNPISKNKTYIVFKEKYYRVYNGHIQQSINNSNWTDVCTLIYSKLIFVVYGRLYGFGKNGSIVMSEDGSNWTLLKDDFQMKKSCIAFDRYYMLPSNVTKDGNKIYFLDSEKELHSVVYNPNYSSGESCKDIFFKNGILILFTSFGIYKSTDGLNFIKTANFQETIEGNIFYNEDNGTYNVIVYSNVLYSSTNGDNWNIIPFNLPSNYRRIESYHMAYFNGSYYYGFMTSIDGTTYERILKTTDFQSFTAVYEPTEISDFIGFQDVYSDSEQIIFTGCGCLLRSTDGNTFSKINYPNTNLRVLCIRKIGDTFYMTANAASYTTTKDFVNFETINSPQLNASKISDVNIFDYGLYIMGEIRASSEFGYFCGGEVNIVESNIINILSANSSLNFNLDKGSNLLFFSANAISTCRIKYRQKYIGV